MKYKTRVEIIYADKVCLWGLTVYSRNIYIERNRDRGRE